MNYGPLIFLGALLTFATSWYGLVVGPVLQLGNAQPVAVETSSTPYPAPRSGLAQQGRDVYRASGCQYCHTQQVTGRPEIRGTNFLGYAGADISRGWGARPSVGEDYLYDQPVMVGQERIGPDLANIGVRQTNAVWHLSHLYDPRSVAPGSLMPSYRFLFEKRKIKGRGSPGALPVPGLAEGYEIVPTSRAQALVAYLQSLNAEMPLMEAPLPMKPAGGTNQPPAAVPTNNAVTPSPAAVPPAK